MPTVNIKNQKKCTNVCVVSALLLFLLFSFSAFSSVWTCKNTGDGGIGGTGKSTDEKGVGGTGKMPGGIGGTGKSAKENGLGGTGKTPGGVGGTGKSAKENGLGGTGKKPGGIGGTGISTSDEGSGIGGTGIIGTITSFGSVCVNGFRVQYTDKTQYRSDGKPITKDKLAVGQLIKIDTFRTSKGLFAKTIRVDYVVSGQVEAINRRDNTIVILGQIIKLTNHNKIGQLNSIKVGDYLQVSGLRTPSGVIDGTYVLKTNFSNEVLLKGRITYIGANHLVINGKRVNLSTRLSRQLEYALKVGQLIKVHGQYHNNRFVAVDVQMISTIPFKGKYKRFSLQGYAVPTSKNNVFYLFNTPVHFNLKSKNIKQAIDRIVKGDVRINVSVHINNARQVIVDKVRFSSRSIELPVRRHPRSNNGKNGGKDNFVSQPDSINNDTETGSGSDNIQEDPDKSGRSNESREESGSGDDSGKSGGDKSAEITPEVLDAPSVEPISSPESVDTTERESDSGKTSD